MIFFVVDTMEKPHSESNKNKTKPPSQPDSKDKLKTEESLKKRILF
jgi:hypothetical protein